MVEPSMATENVFCPRAFYPWVRGPYNENVDRLTGQFDIKINIPPTTAQNEIIVISGEREGVHRAAAEIKAIVANKQATAKEMHLTLPRAQHRYLIGHQRSGLHEILKATGVVVDVPPEESNSEIVILRGELAQFARAAGIVVTRAFSTVTMQVNAPNWLHRFIIGPKGTTLQKLVGKSDRLKIDFLESAQIHLEGPPTEVDVAASILKNEVERLEKEMAVEKIQIDPSLHKRIIGKGGCRITKIKEETGVQIIIPNESTNSDEITIQGKSDGVQRALIEIRQLVSEIMNDRPKDKQKKAHPKVPLPLSPVYNNLDVGIILSNKAEIDVVHMKLTTSSEEAESDYEDRAPILQEYRNAIVGIDGAYLKKVEEETRTMITVNEGGKILAYATVRGTETNVKKALKILIDRQAELENGVSTEEDIPTKVQDSLPDGGNLECREVSGELPPSPSKKSDITTVTVRGPAADADKAVSYLTALAQDKEIDIYEDTVVAQAKHHKFLIGKGGARVKRLREQYNVTIKFPQYDDADQETIHLLGRKDQVLQVKKELESSIKQLNETTEAKMEVDSKYHKHFLQRGAALINEIQEQNGGVQISFPPRDSGNTVSIKGSKQCVESATARIEEIMKTLACLPVIVPTEHISTILANRCHKINDIQIRYSVKVELPPPSHKDKCSTGRTTTFRIIGRNTDCEAAKAALVALIPITKTIRVPLDMHRSLIGKQGGEIHKLTHDQSESNPAGGAVQGVPMVPDPGDWSVSMANASNEGR